MLVPVTQGLGIRSFEMPDGRWCLVLLNADEQTYQLFHELGLQSGGYTWEPITRALVGLESNELASSLDIHAEGDEMYVYAPRRDPLIALECLLRRASGDHALLRRAMELAGDDLE